MDLGSVFQAIQTHNIPASVAACQAWLAKAELGAPERAIRDCPEQIRPNFVALLRDQLSHYPRTLVGAPMLVYWAPESATAGQRLLLPRPVGEDIEPCQELGFRGWLNADTELPLSEPFKAQPVYVQGGQLSAVVALFSYRPEVSEVGEFGLEDAMEVPPLWWARLFLGAPGSLRISSRVLLPYPDALEAARGLLAAARLEAQAEAVWMSPVTANFVMEAGAVFRAGCAEQFPDHVL